MHIKTNKTLTKLHKNCAHHIIFSLGEGFTQVGQYTLSKNEN